MSPELIAEVQSAEKILIGVLQRLPLGVFELRGQHCQLVDVLCWRSYLESSIKDLRLLLGKQG